MGARKKQSSSSAAVRRKKGGDTTAALVFNQSDRIEYVTGFQKRNKERREAALLDQKEKEKKEVKAAGQAYKQQVIEQNARLRKSMAEDAVRWGTDAPEFPLDPTNLRSNKKVATKRRVTRMESSFYGGGGEPTEVTVNVDYTTPALLRDPLQQKRPPKPEADIGKPEEKIKKQNIKKKYKRTPTSKLKVSKRAKYRARFRKPQAT